MWYISTALYVSRLHSPFLFSLFFFNLPSSLLGVTQEGVYRTVGSNIQVQKLLNAFFGKEITLRTRSTSVHLLRFLAWVSPRTQPVLQVLLSLGVWMMGKYQQVAHFMASNAEVILYFKWSSYRLTHWESSPCSALTFKFNLTELSKVFFFLTHFFDFSGSIYMSWQHFLMQQSAVS